jgi:hypothetical protein
MKRVAFLIVLLGMVLPITPASADVFGGSELLVGRSVKPPLGATRFQVGLDLQFAPLNMLLSSQKDKIIESGLKEGCANAPDPAVCLETAKGNADTAFTAMSEVSDEDWEKVNQNLGDMNQLKATLTDAGLPAEDADAVVGYVETVPEEDRKGAIALSRQLGSESATTVMAEPYLMLNFKLMSFSIHLPLAIYLLENSTEYNFGNIMLDSKIGYVTDAGFVGFALTGGLSIYLPTGTEEADVLGLSNLFYGPKFFHEYMTLAPYGVIGFDTTIFSAQAHAELVNQLPVRGDSGDENVIYGKYGAGLVVFPRFLISFIGEINGVAPISNADAYNAIFGSFGAQLKLIWLKASVAGMIPISKPAQEDLGSLGGVSLGDVADFTLLGRLAFSF